MGFIDQIRMIMTDSDRETNMGLRAGLYAISRLYAKGLCLRKIAYHKGLVETKRLPCVVISVGNMTLGGTGKTPMTIYLAQLIRSLNYRVTVVSRGYGGSAEKQGGIVSDGQTIFMQAQAAGDEPYLIAQKLADVPVVVGRNRYRAGMEAIRHFRPDVIVLDDAFQHWAIARDVDLVLLDAEKPFGNGFLFPRGVLREDVASLTRGHAIVLTRVKNSNFIENGKLKGVLKDQPVFQSIHAPVIHRIVPGGYRSEKEAGSTRPVSKLSCLEGKKAFVFSGIARNDSFQEMIRNLGCRLTGVYSFPDHYTYDKKILERIKKQAARKQAECIVTTEKDYVRLEEVGNWPVDLIVMGVEIVFPDTAFNRFITQRLMTLSSKGSAQNNGCRG